MRPKLPISDRSLGCELYICKKDDHRRGGRKADKYNHLLVLAESDEGYRNLMKITSEAFTARHVLQATREQEVSGGTFEGSDRIVWLSRGGRSAKS